ncbi:MAG: hypothetical protein A2Z17_06975 [Gammaproteobacteria bacterium RBG_16_66_13]|nr:MAG: hypothetical protein A2Z17_06975 [Gammaproteobacteria bacterium RBG_16_66_13]
MALPFLHDNTVSRRRLEALARHLSDEDLLRSTPDGWTVAALFAHLAFWDRRVFVLLLRWKEKGVDPSPIDADALNDALKPLCLALDPRTAVRLCPSSADAADAELSTIGSELIERIQASPTHFRFNRALHRNDHLDQIELLLQTP